MTTWTRLSGRLPSALLPALLVEVFSVFSVFSVISVISVILIILIMASPVAAQENPVYVDDSPRAWELFQRARDQITDNTAESVRLLQELLDEYAFKLAPVTDSSTEHFTAVRQLVTTLLQSDPILLERYQTIESSEAKRLLEAGELDRLAVTRSLTGPGLDAMLRLSQEAIEDARFHAALGWLSEARTHPDLTEELAAHCWYMTGVAGWYLSDTQIVRDARETLTGLNSRGEPFLERLRVAEASGAGPQIQQGISPLEQTDATDLNDLVAEEIWSVTLDDSLLSRRYPGMDLPGRDQQRRSGDLMTAAATVAGATVYINEGHFIRALDRFTGRERWSHLVRRRDSGLDPDSDRTLDMNFITVAGDMLVTLTGHASADGRTTDGQVTCLDARTGERYWTRSLNRIGHLDEHEGLFPHGQPIIHEGVVYILGRKVTRQLLTSCYVIALNLDNGWLRWSRHIASSGGLRRSARSLSTLSQRDGDIYVATAVGAITRLHGNTGQIRWLRRYHVPISPRFQEQNRKPWELPAPVVTTESVIAMQPGERRVVALDRESGHQLESYYADTPEGWNAPRYLLANDHSVYAIGRQVRAFRIGMLDQPLWQLSEESIEADPRLNSLPRPIEICGRVQLADGALIVPTLEGVLVLDDETGMLTHHLPVRSIGTPVASGAQLLLAGSDRLDAFMSFRRAEEMLRQRIAGNPEDPEPALSLLRLGVRARRLDLALEASGLALDAASRAPAAESSRRGRRELFDLLLELDASGAATTRREGESLHAMIGSVAMEPYQQVEHLLAHGEWMMRYSRSGAIESFQRILGDPRLAPLTRVESGLMRPASEWAADRIRVVLNEHGVNTYAPQADFARLRLQEIAMEPSAEIDSMVDIAGQYPFADAGHQAAIRAADQLHRRGDVRAALAVLARGYRLDPTAGPQLLGRYVSLCLDAKWPDTARSALRHVVRTAPGLKLETSDDGPGPLTAAAWLDRLDEVGRAGARRRMPRVGKQEGLAEGLIGRMVPVPPDHTMIDQALLYDDRELRMISSRELAVRWALPLEGTGPIILDANPESILLWFRENATGPRVMRLDADTGETLWTLPPLSGHVAVPRPGQGRGVRDLMPNGEPFRPSQMLPLVNGSTMAVAFRTGDVIAFDMSTPKGERGRRGNDRDPIWLAERVLEQIHFARMTELGLILAGMQRDPEADPGTLMPRILVLDPASGRIVHRIKPMGRAGVKWMDIGPLGTIMFATADGLESADLFTGDRRWSHLAFAARDSQFGWAVGDMIVLEDQDNELRAVRFGSGKLSEPFSVPTHGEWDPLELQDIHVVDGRIYARYRQRLVLFDETGSVIGADVVTGNRDYTWLLPVEEGLLLVSRYKTEQQALETGRRTVHTYRIYSLSENCKMRDENELQTKTQRLYDAAVIDGWVMLSTQSDTLAVPMPAE